MAASRTEAAPIGRFRHYYTGPRRGRRARHRSRSSRFSDPALRPPVHMHFRHVMERIGLGPLACRLDDLAAGRGLVHLDRLATDAYRSR